MVDFVRRQVNGNTYTLAEAVLSHISRGTFDVMHSCIILFLLYYYYYYYYWYE
jgi:hypothetical protein